MKHTALVVLDGVREPLRVTFDNGELDGDFLATALLKDRLRTIEKFGGVSPPVAPSLDSAEGFAALLTITFDDVLRVEPRILVPADDTA